jgi:Niemann-Pick C1 protein
VCIFIVFGIALDDTFIIFGSYISTDPSKDPVERIRDTMEEVSISIFMTTATTVFAFGLGCITTIPAIQWLCKYGVTTIAIDFLWQITMFVPLLVLDERRIESRRADCLICCKVAQPESDNEQNEGSVSDFSTNQSTKSDDDFDKHEHVSVWLMRKVSNFLFLPRVKVLVVVCFSALFGVCIWGATQLEVDFDFRTVLPSDSYIIRFQSSLTDFTQRQGPSPYIYFRNVNQSDPEVWEFMDGYVNDTVHIDAISAQPFHFWIRDFRIFLESNATMAELPFNESLALFLDNPEYMDYKKDMVLDGFGNIIASRTMVHMDNVDPTKFEDGNRAIKETSGISANNPLNDDSDDWSFFVFEKIFFLWEFLIIAPSQLKQSTLIGVACVTLMSMFFMPHWSGVLFVAPMTAILYVDLLGVLWFAGIDINAISYVALVMAIGLLVDYSMHVVLKFQEIPKSSRNQGANDVLQSMGASVLLGGVSTLMGILPLVFSSSDLTVTFVVSLVSVVLLGLSHGLIFLPVVLSLLGHCPGEAHPLEFMFCASSSTTNDSNGKNSQSLQTTSG